LLNPWGQALATQALADAHLALGNLDLAEQFVHEAMRLEDVSLMPEIYQTLGEIRAAQRQFPEAEKQIMQSIETALANSDLRLEAHAYRALGKVYQQQQKSGQANTAFDKAIDIFERLKLDNEVAATSVLKVHD